MATAPLIDAPAATVPWYAADEPRRIYATIEELCGICARLNQLDREHRFMSLGEAADIVGHLTFHRAEIGINRFENLLRPSNGTSTVSQLWDRLGELRTEWLRTHAAARGHTCPYDLPVGAAGVEEAFDSWDALDRETPDVEAARAIVLREGVPPQTSPNPCRFAAAT